MIGSFIGESRGGLDAKKSTPIYLAAKRSNKGLSQKIHTK